MTTVEEIFISVDVETSGPIPGEFSLLSIGACAVDRPDQRFECLLKPITQRADPKALEVSGLSLETIQHHGLEPVQAMERFESWVGQIAGEAGTPIFVGFNAPFDWSFINYYFHRFLRRNPFGFTALDIKAYYMGSAGTSWEATRSSKMRTQLDATLEGDHNPVNDALAQAELFRLARTKR